jgi:hypothetical protein
MSEVFVDAKGMAHDDEGHTWKVGGGVYPGTHKGGSVRTPMPSQDWRNRSEEESDMVQAISMAFTRDPGNSFLRSMFRLTRNVPMRLSPKQKKALRDILYRMGLKKEAKLFEEKGTSMRALLERLEDADLFSKERATRGGAPDEQKKLKQFEAELRDIEKRSTALEKQLTSEGMKKVNSNMVFKKAMKNRTSVFKSLKGDWSAVAMTKKRQAEVDAYKAYIDAMNKVLDEYRDASPTLRKTYIKV